MALYTVSPGDKPMASDLDQLVNVFNGKNDIGDITFAPQISAPADGFTAAASAGTGLPAGTYKYVLTYKTGIRKSNGTMVYQSETGVNTSVSVTTSSTNLQVTLSSLPTDWPDSAVGLAIYRTTVGGSTYKLVTVLTVASSTYIDSMVDANLGANAPSSNTTGTTVTLASDPTTNLGAATKQYVDNAKDTIPDLTSSLEHGLQNLDVDQASLATPTFYGRTLTNIGGKDWNCESLDPFTTGGTVELATDWFNDGSHSIKLTSSGGTTSYFDKEYTYPLDTAKQYVLACWCYIDSYTAGTIRMTLRDIGTNTIRYTVSPDTSKIGVKQLIYVKIPTSNTLVGTGFKLLIGNEITPTCTVHFDSVRLYELSASDYAAIGTTYTTDDEIDAFIPYVNGVQHVLCPAIRKSGKNLLPPFTEWTLHANAVATEPYSLTLNATGASQFSYIGVPVLPNTTYTVYIDVTGGTNTRWNVSTVSANNNNFIQNASSSTSITFTTDATTTLIYVNVYCNAAGAFTFSNPILVLGSTYDGAFEAQNDDYLYGVTDSEGNPLKLGSDVGRTVYDSLTYRDGDWWLTKRWMKMVMDGSLTYSSSTDYTGFKRISTPIVGVNFTQIVSKYDGKILTHYTTDQIDTAQLTANVLYVYISDTDSGWGETYTPSSAEIKAYFLGWKMNNGTYGTNYNGTGTKTWIPWGDTDNTNAVTTCPTTVSTAISGGTYDYYRLSYQLATATTEVVTVEGSIGLQSGGNQIEVLEGVVYQEVANPIYRSADSTYNINRSDLSSTGYLKYRTAIILKVYRNGVEDDKWGIWTSVANGNQRVQIAASDYDDTATYTATYEMLDKYLYTSNLVEVDLSYAANLGSTVSKLVQGLSDNDSHDTAQDWRLLVDEAYSDNIRFDLDAHIALTSSVSESLLTGTSQTTVLSYTPSKAGNFVVYISARVITAATNLTVVVTYTDATGAQTNTVIPLTSFAVGTHQIGLPLFINSVANDAISVKITAGTANQVYASSSIVGV